jgi:hypothetical protein
LAHAGERVVIAPELIRDGRQLGDAHGVEPVWVDLLEVVSDVEHRKSINLEARLRLLLLGRRSRAIRVAAESHRNIGDGALRPHAVAGVIERRGNDGDAELAGRHGDDAAADAALGRKARVVQPLPRVVVQSGGGHDGEDTGDLCGVHDLFPGDRIPASRCQRCRHRRQILRVHPNGALTSVDVDRLLPVALDVTVREHERADGLVALVSVGFGLVDVLQNAQLSSRGVVVKADDLLPNRIRCRSGHHARRRDRARIH